MRIHVLSLALVGLATATHAQDPGAAVATGDQQKHGGSPTVQELPGPMLGLADAGTLPARGGEPPEPPARSLILATHDPEVAQRCDRVVRVVLTEIRQQNLEREQKRPVSGGIGPCIPPAVGLS